VAWGLSAWECAAGIRPRAPCAGPPHRRTPTARSPGSGRAVERQQSHAANDERPVLSGHGDGHSEDVGCSASDELKGLAGHDRRRDQHPRSAARMSRRGLARVPAHRRQAGREPRRHRSSLAALPRGHGPARPQLGQSPTAATRVNVLPEPDQALRTDDAAMMAGSHGGRRKGPIQGRRARGVLVPSCWRNLSKANGRNAGSCLRPCRRRAAAPGGPQCRAGPRRGPRAAELMAFVTRLERPVVAGPIAHHPDRMFADRRAERQALDRRIPGGRVRRYLDHTLQVDELRAEH